MSEIIQALLDALRIATFQTLKKTPQQQDIYLRARPERDGRQSRGRR